MFRTSILKTYVALFVVAVATTTSVAVEQHVSVRGSESGTGSPASPWGTIGRALQAAQPGDVIVLHEGIYEEQVRILVPQITIMSAEKEWAVIKAPIGTDNSPGLCVKFDVDASGGALKRLELIGGYYGIKIESRWDWGVADQSGATDILIEDCVIHDTGRDCIKITPNCDRITIRRCEVFNSGQIYPPGTPFEQKNAEGIDITNADRVLVQDCNVHDITTTGVYFKGGATDCVVERTRVSRCGHGGVLLGFDTSPEFFDLEANPNWYENIGGIVRNCIIEEIDYEGIGFFAASGAKALNNTVINTARVGHNPIYFGLTLQDWDPTAKRPPSVDVEVRNNIVLQSEPIDAAFVFIRYLFEPELGQLSALDGMPLMSNNIYFSNSAAPLFTDSRPTSVLQNADFAAWKAHIGGDVDSFVVDPMLDVEGHLTEKSPAIDGGVELALVKVDFDGESRPSGAATDIGADEFGSRPAPPDMPCEEPTDPACGPVNQPKGEPVSPSNGQDKDPPIEDEPEPVVDAMPGCGAFTPFAGFLGMSLGLLSLRSAARTRLRSRR